MKSSLTRFAWFSICAALITIMLKSTAFFLTGSVGLLSDALESFVNLAAAIIALFMLKIAEKPPDENHMYGHTKAEYFASVSEGLFIIIAALTIVIAAVDRIFHPQTIEQAYIGLGVSAIASVINLLAAVYLIRAGKRYNSITLDADGQHLLTDVWTSIGVIVGVAVVSITHIQVLDPIIAIIVAFNILFTGYSLMKQSTLGLMDTAIPEEELNKIIEVLNIYCKDGIQYHGLLTRQSATRRFVTVHILVPGKWNIKKGHDLVELIEKEIILTLPKTTVMTHLEPLEDPASLEDISIDR